MKWQKLTDLGQLTNLQGSTDTILIFKHSTRCSISNTVLNRLERNWNDEEMRHIDTYYLDLLTYHKPGR